MRKISLMSVAILAIAGAAMAVAGQGCGDSGSTGGGGPGGGSNTNPTNGGSTPTNTGGSTSTSSENGGSSQGGSGGTAAQGGGGAGGAPQDVCSGPAGDTINGCKADGSDAMDLSGDKEVTINFGGVQLGDVYKPKCIIVKPQQKVSFVGSFDNHPLDAGEIRGSGANAKACPDGSNHNPLKAPIGSASPQTFMLDAGTYPYFCDVHGAAFGMDGLIIVKN
jgi:plastocyanin